jgi:hypothetical protein
METKMKKLHALMFCFTLAAPGVALASAATDAEFAQFKKDGATKFSAEQGKQNWTKEVTSKEGDKRSCTSCHDADLTKPGKHNKTKKVIDAMAPSVTPDRFTDQKKIEKWFKRNCEWTWGRECTAQEKGDFLKFLTGAN